VVVGWRDVVYSGGGISGGDFLLQSFLHDTAAELYPLVTQPSGSILQLIRNGALGGTVGGVATPPITAFDRPAATGEIRATRTATPVWSENGLGDPAGGGIAVDARARVTVVGQTYSTNYPVQGGLGPDNSTGAPRLPDAVRTTIDMLPPGVGRTDGTGDPLPGGASCWVYGRNDAGLCAVALRDPDRWSRSRGGAGRSYLPLPAASLDGFRRHWTSRFAKSPESSCERKRCLRSATFKPGFRFFCALAADHCCECASDWISPSCDGARSAGALGTRPTRIGWYFAAQSPTAPKANAPARHYHSGACRH
jgi:hypothetical protein